MTAYRNPMTKDEIIAEHKNLERMYYKGQMGYSDMLRNKKELDKKLMELAWRKALEK